MNNIDNIKKAHDLDCDALREVSSDYMAEKLMDPQYSSHKMFEDLVSDYLNGSEELRKGIDRACTILTGWSLDTIAMDILQRYEEAQGRNM
jgi:hypothetical protein